MRYRTFCALLASVLMLMGAGIGWFQKSREQTELLEEAAQFPERMILPVEGTVKEAFGARYSEEYGQWTMNDRLVIRWNGVQQTIAPMDGWVEEIEAHEGGGSSITIACDGVRIRMTPVYSVRVFEGSVLKKGSVFGAAQDELTIYAEADGRPVDPEALAEQIG